MNVICDLDGVVYRGRKLMPGAGAALADLAGAGIPVFYVTNNSTKTPQEVVEKLAEIAGVEVPADRVITSSQSAAAMLGEADHPAYVLGSPAIAAALRERDVPVTTAHESAASVVVGMDWELTYERLSHAVDAVRNGARLIATNTDPTFPTETGFLPGSGSIVAAVEVAAEVKAEVAGKPHEPMRRLMKARGITDAWVIGDRLDTDVALARHEDGWCSILVLTGVTSSDGDHPEADHVARDLREAADLILAGQRER